MHKGWPPSCAPTHHYMNLSNAPLPTHTHQCRDAEDTYLPAFEACVREGVGSIMCSYNAINGTPACANEWLLNQTLRGDWGFTGFVVSDCDAIEAISDQHAYVATPAEGAAAALKAGTDLACLKYDPLEDALAQVGWLLVLLAGCAPCWLCRQAEKVSAGGWVLFLLACVPSRVCCLRF